MITLAALFPRVLDRLNAWQDRIERQALERYLAKSTDHNDLEHRQRALFQNFQKENLS